MRLEPTRLALDLRPDHCRVIGRPYIPGEDSHADGRPRFTAVVQRVLAIRDDEAEELLADVRRRFGSRHRDLDEMLRRNSERAPDLPDDLDPGRRLLLGAYLTHEYAFEAAALTNPSMVPAPDQRGLAEGELRFMLSLRAVGEGHLSSIEFRSGVSRADGTVEVEAPSPWAETGERSSPVYERKLFGLKLHELGADLELVGRVLDPLPRHFTRPELEQAITVLEDLPRAIAHETTKLMYWLAASNYLLEFKPDTLLAERILFPEGPFESRGMEDARFVRFSDNDGTTTYYATYTAYDGFEILPQLIETDDFRRFEITTMNGKSAQNKGMALFPRTIDDRYVALSRIDRESIRLTRSDNPRFWSGPTVPLRGPSRPWELFQMGNCGSPLETSEGWLVLTHGVGPMRTYRLGALLLDLEDPTRVVADLPEPLLEANDEERDGYVPNVVYSCGAMRHDDRLLLPYGFSDTGARIATLSISDLLESLSAHRV